MTECQSLFQPLNADTGGTTQAATALPRRAYPEHEGGRGQRRETASATARGPPGESEGEEGQKRQREVVDRLHGKRPSRSDAAPDGARSVVLSKDAVPSRRPGSKRPPGPRSLPCRTSTVCRPSPVTSRITQYAGRIRSARLRRYVENDGSFSDL